MHFFIILAAVVFSSTACAEIYQWVDDKGQRHFTDRPIDKAEPLEFFDSEHASIAENRSERPSGNSGKSFTRPERKAITADDYAISVRVAQIRDRVTLSGRISEGPPCRRFKIDFTVQDTEGHLVHLITVVEDIGGFLSELIDVSKRVKYGNSDNEWKVIATNGVCLK